MKTILYGVLASLLVFTSCSTKSEACECVKYTLDGTIGDRIHNYDGTYYETWKSKNEALDAKCTNWFENATEEQKEEMKLCEDWEELQKELKLMGDHFGIESKL